MLVAHLDPLASSLFSLMAIASLLLAFVMLGSRWLNNYLYAFAAESWIIATLSATVRLLRRLSRALFCRDPNGAFSRSLPSLSALAHRAASQRRARNP